MCNGKQKLKTREKVWDDKFGLLEVNSFFEDDCTQRAKEQTEAREKEYDKEFLGTKPKIKIKGIGKDAEVITNEKGGKQSKSPMALHLVDPEFLKAFAADRGDALEFEDEGESTFVEDKDLNAYRCYRAIENIAEFMLSDDKTFLIWAMDNLEYEELNQIISIAKVLQYGASRYEANNWRLIPQEEHINHALIHIIANLTGDTQDDHIEHALCRLMMAYSTKKSDNFEYNKYVDTNVF